MAGLLRASEEWCLDDRPLAHELSGDRTIQFGSGFNRLNRAKTELLERGVINVYFSAVKGAPIEERISRLRDCVLSTAVR